MIVPKAWASPRRIMLPEPKALVMVEIAQSRASFLGLASGVGTGIVLAIRCGVRRFALGAIVSSFSCAQ